MVKKKRNKIKITIGKRIKPSNNKINEHPPCYGDRKDYCRKDICGDHFDSCQPTQS